MNEEMLLRNWEHEAQQPFQGWDFSYLNERYHEETPPWSYEERVRALLPGAVSLLDMGTGGGEKLLEFRELFPPLTVATEGFAPNIPLATANLSAYGVQVVPYDSELDARLPFADESFQVILNRHEAYQAEEIARVLAPNGIFCTQQVDGRNLEDLHSVFGIQTAYPHVTLENFQHDLEVAGLRIQAAFDWQGKATFVDVGALVYYLHAVPWEAPPDFSVRRYKDELFALHKRPVLEFTIRRFLVQAVKER
jgi:SAM-dependent methyltransferase